MGSSASKEQGLISRPSAEHAKKVAPLLRANHKHQLLLTVPRTDAPAERVTGQTTTTENHGRATTLISQSLSAASLLGIQPVSALFELWDVIAKDTLDVTDSEDEIVRIDYLSPEHLGHEHQATRYVDFFDDEVVRLLYSYEGCAKEYLSVPEVVDGLLARQGWGVRQLAYAMEMGSKDMCTEALGGALAFHVALPKQDMLDESSVLVPETEQDVVQARNAVMEETLQSKVDGISVVSELVVLNSICTLWSYMPKTQFARIWTWQVNRLQALPASASATTDSSKDKIADNELAWTAIIRDVCETKPLYLPELRLLKDHPSHGFAVAQRLFVSA